MTAASGERNVAESFWCVWQFPFFRYPTTDTRGKWWLVWVARSVFFAAMITVLKNESFMHSANVVRLLSPTHFVKSQTQCASFTSALRLFSQQGGFILRNCKPKCLMCYPLPSSSFCPFWTTIEGTTLALGPGTFRPSRKKFIVVGYFGSLFFFLVFREGHFQVKRPQQKVGLSTITEMLHPWRKDGSACQNEVIWSEKSPQFDPEIVAGFVVALVMDISLFTLSAVACLIVVSFP